LVDEGWTLLDVRSEAEFSAEHPAGAFNVPLAHLAAGGMTPNPEFAAVVAACFARDAKLVLTCKSGGRSLRAARELAALGYVNLVDQRAGFDGARDPFGALVEPGWKAAGLPLDTGNGGDRSYALLAARPR
jgi:rhodanese-related sulfurtransferase